MASLRRGPVAEVEEVSGGGAGGEERKGWMDVGEAGAVNRPWSVVGPRSSLSYLLSSITRHARPQGRWGRGRGREVTGG